MDLYDFISDPASREILRERARSLAGQDQIASAKLGELTLQFTLGNARYSLPASAAREVLRFESIAPLPAVPPAIVGLVNVRGRLLVCVDIRPLLGLPPAAPNPTMRLLIVSAGSLEAALLVDDVISVQPETSNLQPTPATVAGHGAGWVRGVDEQLSLHLDPAGLLNDPRLAVHGNDETFQP